ncbi:MAG: radical SAM protein, partial [Oscillospiraceae bacterium]|nr:radical SAM protein [Oscillospiraceae bacterium]
MAVKIAKVKPFSKCMLLGVRSGDMLVSVNGDEILDVLDYDFYTGGGKPEAEIKKADGKVVKIKGFNGSDLKFGTYLMDSQKCCGNKCIFCFIDQMPKGCRESLYFKDDDSRLSFLFGNYITLCSLTERDIGRIIKMRISPVNISVHTMSRGLRSEMMGNPRAGDALEILNRVYGADIKMNAQLVLCPGINDGKELE